MLGEMTSAQFAEWAAYYQLEPWGEERADVRHGILTSVLANCHRGKSAAAFKPKDFIVDYEKPSQPDPHALRRQAEMLNALFGGRVVKPKPKGA
jgi:hypothetical protein